MAHSRCFNCGANVEDADVQPHPYMVSTPGCWAAFGALQAEESARFGYPPVHGVAVDAYAASHGGDGSDRRDRQSVLLHLIALHSLFERGDPPERRVPLLRQLADMKADWPPLDRPPGTPRLNFTHARAADDVDDYSRRVREWALAVWEFWAPEHARIGTLAEKQPRPRDA